METMIDRFGRVLIPKRVRDNLGIRPGITLRIEECEGTIHLRPLAEEVVLADEDGVLVFTGGLNGDIGAALDDLREQRLATLGGEPQR